MKTFVAAAMIFFSSAAVVWAAPKADPKKDAAKAEAGDEPAYEGKSLSVWIKDLGRKYTPEAIEALARIGVEGAKTSVPAMVKSWNRNEPGARPAIAGALAGLGAEAKEALPLLLAAVGDEKQPADVRNAAIPAVVALGGGSRSYATLVGNAVRKDPKNLARAGATALGLLRDDGLLELTKCFADKSKPVRLLLCRGLEKVMTGGRGTHLLDLLDKLSATDPEADVRRETVAIAKTIRRNDSLKR
jgi:hypothetical protein